MQKYKDWLVNCFVWLVDNRQTVWCWQRCLYYSVFSTLFGMLNPNWRAYLFGGVEAINHWYNVGPLAKLVHNSNNNYGLWHHMIRIATYSGVYWPTNITGGGHWISLVLYMIYVFIWLLLYIYNYIYIIIYIFGIYIHTIFVHDILYSIFNIYKYIYTCRMLQEYQSREK